MIHKTQTGTTVTLVLEGKLDSVTQSELAREVEDVFQPGLTALIFDLAGLDYISSAGLRVLMAARKRAESLGVTMTMVRAKESVREIFRIVAFPLDD